MISSEVKHDLHPSPLWRYWVARFLLRRMGWSVDEQPPKGKKFVMVCAPHTSNWDAYMLILAASVYRLRIQFLFKSDISPFLKPILTLFGGVPIDRSGGTGIVEQSANHIKAASSVLLAIAPAGHRRFTDRWKSGFYWIAKEANVPVVAGICDYASKSVRIGGPIDLSDDLKHDMDRIRALLEGVTGYHPENFSTIVLKEELEGAS